MLSFRHYYAVLWLLILLSPQVFGHPAWGLVGDDNGNLFFADIFSNGRGTVWQYTASGELVALLKNYHAHNVNLDSKGRVLTAHGEGVHKLTRLDMRSMTREVLVETSDEEAFFGGNAAVTPTGRIYFGIRKFIWEYKEGEAPRRRSKHMLEWNQAIFVDGDERIYVPDIGVGDGSVFEIDKNGRARLIADRLRSDAGRPRDRHNDVLLGMAKDSEGRLYVAETAGRRIARIENGKVNTFYRSRDGWTPRAITFSRGLAFVLEYGRFDGDYDFRIVRIGESGPSELIRKSTATRIKTAEFRTLVDRKKSMSGISLSAPQDPASHFSASNLCNPSTLNIEWLSSRTPRDTYDLWLRDIFDIR